MLWCSARCTLAGMMHRTFVLTVGMLGAALPGHARGEDAVTLVEVVRTLASKGEHAAAAAKAAAGAASVQLDPDSRVLLGGLARASYEQSFAESRDLHDLCELSKVMRLVAALDSEDSEAARQQMLAAAEEAEGRLRDAKGADWRSFCSLAAVEAAGETVAPHGTPVSAVVPEQRETPARIALGRQPPDAALASRADRRVMYAGAATLTAGTTLMAPVIAMLVYRRDGEVELANLRVIAAGREETDAEQALADSLGRRYRNSTIVATALGTTSAALVITGAVLLATGKSRRARTTVAPWGARGAGGLVFSGRF
jgi:hypothetical protein